MRSGSSPRRRGKFFLTDLVRIVVGITPAWAGKRRPTLRASPRAWDHPRVGGEKLRMGFLRGLVLGSPPHGRGKAFSVLRRQFRFRITPAWAGKSGSIHGFGSLTQDHPRMGGEKCTGKGEKGEAAGSPPRWRGKVRASRLAVGDGGITPAWAGKS